MNAKPPTIRERETIRIAVPILDGKFCEHFGAAKAFLIFEADRETQRLCRKDVFNAPEHKPGALPKWLRHQEVDALVSSSIGERALDLLEKMGIKVFLADEDNEPSALAANCLAGKLVPATARNTRCGGDHHDHGAGHECHH